MSKPEKPIAIAFSDIHLEDWTSYSKDHYRLNYVVDFLFSLRRRASMLGVPLLFAGDLIHNPKAMPNRVHAALGVWVSELREFKTPLAAIPGNHDQCEKNLWDTPSIDYLDGLVGINKLTVGRPLLLDTCMVYGIPYFKYEGDFLKALAKTIADRKQRNTDKPVILLVHQNLPGAKEPDGYDVESDLPEELYKKFKKFDWVLSGHIHKPQQIFKNTFMLGATHQQDLGDMDCEMGYWLIYKDHPPQFQPSGLPEFKYYTGDKPPDDFHLWVKQGQEEEEQVESFSNRFNATKSRTKLAKAYCKDTGIKSKAKKRALIKALNETD